MTLPAGFTTSGLHARAESPTVFSQGLTDLFLGAALLCSGIPETLLPDMRIDEVPFAVILFGIALLLALFESISLAHIGSLAHRRLAVPLLAFMFMALSGAMRRADFRWWGIDVTMFLGLPFGIYWTERRGPIRAISRLNTFAVVAAAFLVFNLAGLSLGFITPVQENGRVFTYALYDCVNFLSLCLPGLFVAAKTAETRWHSVLRTLFACSAATLILAAGCLSATRSVVLTGCGALLLSFWAAARNRLTAALIAASAFIAISLTVSSLATNSFLLDRLFSTHLREEDRFTEAQMMFEDLNGVSEVTFGKGMGSRFRSCVVIDGDDRAIAPHVGILATMYKGGIVTFGAVVVLPIIGVLLQLFRTDIRSRQVGCAAGAIAYLILGSMSGGWTYELLFLYGALVTLAVRPPRDYSQMPSFSRRASVQPPPMRPHKLARSRSSSVVSLPALRVRSSQ
jgi:hypothetical protein